jgi:hypothetical protein
MKDNLDRYCLVYMSADYRQYTAGMWNEATSGLGDTADAKIKRSDMRAGIVRCRNINMSDI